MTAVLAEYVVTEASTLVFLVRPGEDEPRVVEIGLRRDELRRLVGDSFGGRSAERPRTADPDAWREPLDRLVAPIADVCGEGDQVWLVPGDVLHYVPMHALRIGDVSLAERNPVCYTPSASVMRYCRAKRRPDSGRSLVFADSRATRPLSHARDQAFAIAARYGAELHTGAATTRDLVEKRLTGEHLDVLHFACHGEFDQADPMRSGVLLAGDDRLTAADLLRLPVNANLVTLSACESGVSAQRPGNELMGLTRALVYAGASAVLVSLWSVDEISTNLLMQYFYRALYDGAGKAAALRRAMLHVRDVTLAEVVAYGEEAIARLDAVAPEHVGPDTRAQLAEDIADARYRAGDFPAALADYEHLLAASSPDAPTATATSPEPAEPPAGSSAGTAAGSSSRYTALARAAARCRTVLRTGGGATPDYGRQPFVHPYYWAPFVLVGDWR